MVGAKLGTSQYIFKEAPGDVNLKDPLWKMPEMGVFTSFLRRYLIGKEVDLVVHSWKDLPIDNDGLTEIVATLPRADPRDLLLVSKSALSDAYTTGNLIVLSSSPRRKHNLPEFLLKSIPVGPNGERIRTVEFRDVRGNIQTRLGKLCTPESEAHALIVAKAAIDRFVWAGEHFPDEFSETAKLVKKSLAACKWQVLPLSVNPTAAAQGALAIEMLAENKESKTCVANSLNHSETFSAVEEERKILKSLGGGCHQAIGCTILRREYGKVTFLRGRTDTKKEDMMVMKIDPKNPLPVSSGSRAIQIGGKGGLQLFNRTEIPDATRLVEKALTNDPSMGLMVAKSDAMPTGIEVGENRLVWTAGIATWYSLANRGIWVNGSSDSLGKGEETVTEMIAPETREWVKVTHTNSAKGSGEIGTYTLNPKPAISESEMNSIMHSTHFYFSSGSAFVRLIEIVPSLLVDFKSGTRVVACGPGNTLKRIQGILGGIDRVHVAYNYSDYLRQINEAVNSSS